MLDRFLGRRDKMPERRKPLIKLPKDWNKWDKSFTNQFDTEQLELIRDGSVGEVLNRFNKPGLRLEPSIIVELLAHGMGKKAALITREFLETQKDNPMAEFTLAGSIPDPHILDCLRRENIMNVQKRLYGR